MREMKDSGIEWIGTIPKEWSIIRLCYLIGGYKAGPFGSALIMDKLADEGDILVVNGNGGKNLCGGAVGSYKDHRIVMALSCLGLALKEGEKLTVSDAQWCSVTFPNFFEEMNKLGANFELIEK